MTALRLPTAPCGTVASRPRNFSASVSNQALDHVALFTAGAAFRIPYPQRAHHCARGQRWQDVRR